MKRLMFFLAFVLVSSLSFAQKIQYKDKLTDTEWKTLAVTDIKPKCLVGKEALKLSGDFSKFTMEFEYAYSTHDKYETGPVIAICLMNSMYDDAYRIIHGYYESKPNESLKYVDMSEVTDINSMHLIFYKCYNLATIDFPKNNINTARNFDKAFVSCKLLSKIDLTMFKNIDNIDGVFAGCSNLTEVKFCTKPRNNNLCLGSAFVGCSKLKGIDLSMFKIKDNADIGGCPTPFNACYSLNYVYLPQGYVSHVKYLLDKYDYEDAIEAQACIFGDDLQQRGHDGGNPNCLKILSKNDDDPTGILDGWTNVVYGDKAFTDITLTDGDFEDALEPGVYFSNTYECPEDIQLGDKKAIFTPAKSSPYAYHYANGTSGWNTIVLPFTGALQIGTYDEESKVTTFTNAYPATDNFPGYYWLREYKDGYGNAVTFDVVNDVYKNTGEALKANSPYIFTLPGKSFGDDSMENRQWRFISTTSVLPKTTDKKLQVAGQSGEYAFQGTFNGTQKVAGTAYDLKYGGESSQDYFETTSDAIMPFHAQIIATGASQAKRLSINSPKNATGIVGVKTKTSQKPSTYYTIDGANTGVTDAKLLKKGVYIYGNKKILIK